MSNQSQCKAMMEGIHAPAELLGKVKGIPMEKTKKRGVALRLATATCAGLLGVFVVTNGVCYAATGETWVEKATVCTNSEPAEAGVQMVFESPDGRVVLAPEGVEPIDVTDQLKASGAATGAYDKDGATYAYQVGGEPGN